MVKRKAEVDLEEWLRMAPAISIMEAASQSPTANEDVITPIPAITASSISEGIGVEVTQPADVAANQEDTSAWFWLLLEQSDYDRW